MTVQEVSQWTRIEHIRIGDCLHRWGDKLSVVAIDKSGNTITLTYNDNGKYETLSDTIGKEYMVHRMIQ